MKRRIVISVVAAMMLVGSAYLALAAGGPGGGPGGWGCREGGPGRHIDRMAQVLDLTAAQKEKVSAIIKAEQDKTEPLRQQLFENGEKFRQAAFTEKFDEAAVKAIAAKQAQLQTELMVSHAKTISEIFAVLTPEQRTLAQKLGPMMGPRHGGRMGCMQQFGDDE